MGEIIAVVCPKQRVVKIMESKKVVHTYPITMDIPSKIVEKEVSRYDHGAWSVSERDYTEKIKVKEYDPETIRFIQTEALKIYKKFLETVK